MVAYANYFGFTQDELDGKGIYTRFVQGAVLREILEGKVPQRFKTVEPLPFNFQKSESLVWAFSNVKYYEKRTRREYVGGSHGVSIRIAKGVYYRVGQFKRLPNRKRGASLCRHGNIGSYHKASLLLRQNKKLQSALF